MIVIIIIIIIAYNRLINIFIAFVERWVQLFVLLYISEPQDRCLPKSVGGLRMHVDYRVPRYITSPNYPDKYSE
jgi:hypothetical protein